MRWTELMAACAVASVLVGCGDEVTTGGGGGASSSSGTAGAGATAGGGTGGGGGAGGQSAAQCLADHHWPVAPDYDQFGPILGSHCKGTNHQDITGVEKLVFLGDSITQGTPPTPSSQFYRTQLADKLGQKFPGLEVAECAVNGARVKDLLSGDQQIADCFPGPEPKRTLVVMTLGGNDMLSWASDMLPYDQAKADADQVAADLRAAIEWFYDDPAKFPAGVFVVFANPYEYTDGTAELSSCPGAVIAGLSGTYLEGAAAVSYLEEQYMKIAVDTGTDMAFMLEEFCGHGYKRDTQNSCYLGPDAALWFDLTCIHPNPTGHGKLADLFFAVIDE